MSAFWFTAGFTRRTLPGGKDAGRSLQVGHSGGDAGRWTHNELAAQPHFLNSNRHNGSPTVSPGRPQ